MVDHLRETIDPAQRRRRPDVLPLRQEPPQRRLLHRLDLLAEGGERPTAQPPQHLDRTPLGAARARAELAVHDPAVGGEAAQRVGDDGGSEAEAGRGIRDRERAVGAGVAADQVADRVVDRLDERGGDADRQRHAEGVAQAGGILDHGPLGGARDGDGEDAVGATSAG